MDQSKQTVYKDRIFLVSGDLGRHNLMAAAVEVEKGESQSLFNGADSKDCCADKGPGYASPLEAMSGPRETLLYVTCVYHGENSDLFLVIWWLFCF